MENERNGVREFEKPNPISKQSMHIRIRWKPKTTNMCTTKLARQTIKIQTRSNTFKEQLRARMKAMCIRKTEPNNHKLLHTQSRQAVYIQRQRKSLTATSTT